MEEERRGKKEQQQHQQQEQQQQQQKQKLFLLSVLLNIFLYVPFCFLSERKAFLGRIPVESKKGEGQQTERETALTEIKLS